MKKIIMIKYGELSTKKGNIGYFIDCLKKNILKVIENENVNLKYDKSRMFIEVSDDVLDSVIKKLQTVFGIHEIVVGYKFGETDFNFLSDKLKELIKECSFETFKIETKRSDKNYPLNSMEINKKLGGVVLQALDNVKVDIHNPEVTIYIEIRTNASIIYFEKYNGIGGYPVGALGKGLLMLSGGIDSPVAGYLATKRGVRLEAIYFESPPHTSGSAKNKVKELATKLSKYNYSIKLHVINFTEIQEAIYKNIPHEYLITIMRRMMYRICERIARRNRCKILINGESIGQVASQTLTSMDVINRVVSIPVIRPVACFDKNEIIKIARDIDTYETSILPFEDCCTIFVPEHPVINPELSKCEEYEQKLEYEEMISRAIKGHEVIKITTVNNRYDDIL